MMIKKKYRHVVSLGCSCYVALDLERLGYRLFSYPFDWVISNFSDVINLIDTKFNNFLEIQNIVQDKEHDNCFHDLGSGIDFYHDFFADKTIETQYADIKDKYNRRIIRFYEKGKEPTLYIRQIRGIDDYLWIKENIDYIYSVIHGLSKNSDIIFLYQDELIGLEYIFKSQDYFYPLNSS